MSHQIGNNVQSSIIIHMYFTPDSYVEVTNDIDVAEYNFLHT